VVLVDGRKGKKCDGDIRRKGYVERKDG